MQGAAQNVELYMAFTQRAHTIPLLLLPSWANYTPLVRLSPRCLRSLASLTSCCLCCPHTAWWLKVEECQFFSTWAWWLGYAGAGDSWFCRIPCFCFLETLLEYKQKGMCVCKLRVWMDSETWIRTPTDLSGPIGWWIGIWYYWHFSCWKAY